MCTRLFTAIMALLGLVLFISFKQKGNWESKFVSLDKKGGLIYASDEEGNTLPDFSWVGYQSGDQPIPDIAIVKTITATGENSQGTIQAAIDEVAKRSPG